MEVRFQCNCPGQFHRESQYPGSEGVAGVRGEQNEQRTRKAFYRASPLAELSGTLIALTAFCASRDSWRTDGRTNERASKRASEPVSEWVSEAEGARKIDEAKVEKGEDMGSRDSHCRMCRERKKEREMTFPRILERQWDRHTYSFFSHPVTPSRARRSRVLTCARTRVKKFILFRIVRFFHFSSFGSRPRAWLVISSRCL